jgi:hypothetical protein
MNKDMAFDAPDERDLQLDELAGGIKTTNYPTEILPPHITPVLNQGNTMRCTLFSVAHAVNEMNWTEADKVWVDYQQYNGLEYLNIAQSKYGYSEEKGGFVQNAIKCYRDQWAFTGYASIEKTEDAVKAAIASGRKICCGSNKIDWGKTDRDAVFGSWYWHAFPIQYYVKDWALIKNSLWPNKHDRGYFKVLWKDLDKLFTLYALLDKSDAPALWSLRAIKEGITTQDFNDFRPNDLVTRNELALFVSRYFKVSEDRLWQWVRPNDPATLFELQVMKARATGKPELKTWETINIMRWRAVQEIIKG